MPPKQPPPKKSIPNEKTLNKLQSKEKIVEKPQEIQKKEAEKPKPEVKKPEKSAENSIKNEEKPTNNEAEEKTDEPEKKREDIDAIVKNLILTEKDEKFLIMLSKKLENLDVFIYFF